MSASKQTFLDYQVQQYNDYDSCEWAEIYYQQQMESEYYQWEAEQAATAPVIALYSNVKPAPAAAMQVPTASSKVEQLVKHQDAIQATLSELNMLLLNAATPELRSQVKAIATGLVNKSGLMDSTKENYLQMLGAAEANAIFYHGQRVSTDTLPFPAPYTAATVNPYKRKYDSVADLLRHLATTSFLKEVASLYYVNAEMIEQTAQLKKAFTERKEKLYHKTAAAA